MQLLLLVVVLLIAGIGWLISAVQDGIAKGRRDSEAQVAMRALGLKETDLPALLAKVPSGYLERSLYWAKRRAEEAAKLRGTVSRAQAVVDLHHAIAEHEQAEERSRQRQREAAERAHHEQQAAEQRAQELLALAEACGPPDRQQLVINTGDYTRDNEADRTFRRLYLLRLIALHENACAICGSHDNGLDLDHFFVPKSQGGNFVLTRGDGLRINNAVPMCETCNRAKGVRDWRTVVHHDRLKLILARNVEANKLVNASAPSERQTGTRGRRPRA